MHISSLGQQENITTLTFIDDHDDDNYNDDDHYVLSMS